MPRRLGSFRIGPPLGQGGMGVVHRALQESTGRPVAIKLVQSASAQARALHDEALALGGLDHRGIIQVLDHGEEGGITWLAMPLIDGRSLRTHIAERWLPTAGRSRPPLTLDEHRRYLRWFADLAHALHSLHERGLVHRDVKPANVMIAADDTPYLIDFGLALDVGDQPVTEALAGTVPYMSPEQVLTRAVLDRRTDIYSLAATFFEVASGSRLVRADERSNGVFAAIVFGHPPALSSLAPRLPRGCDAVFRRALAKDPRERYATAALLAADLEAMLAGRQPQHARRSIAERLWQRRGVFAGVAIALTALGFVVLQAAHRRAQLAEFRDGCASSRAGVDLATQALSRAIALQPVLGTEREFQDLYARTLAEAAPAITRAVFRRAALSPSDVVDETHTGRVGTDALLHLQAPLQLAAATRDELVVQAMFAAVRAARPGDALAASELAADREDERIRLLAAVAQLRHGHTDAAAAAVRAIGNDHANLDIDRLCCRAFLLLEFTASEAAASTTALAALADALRRGLDACRADRAARNFVAGLLALCCLAQDQPAEASAVLEDRLADAASGPELRERPAMALLSAVAAFRSLVREETTARARLQRAVDRFVEATTSHTQLVRRFVTEVERDADVPALAGRFDHVAADFFDELAVQRSIGPVITGDLMHLLRFAYQEWDRRQDWRSLLALAVHAAEAERPANRDGPSLDAQHRAFWLVAMHATTLAGPHARLESAAAPAAGFHAAALATVPAPHAEFDTALAYVHCKLRPDDAAAKSRLAECLAQLEQRRRTLPAAAASNLEGTDLAGVLDEEIDTVRELLAR